MLTEDMIELQFSNLTLDSLDWGVWFVIPAHYKPFFHPNHLFETQLSINKCKYVASQHNYVIIAFAINCIFSVVVQECD